jgi:hypothetical protein
VLNIDRVQTEMEVLGKEGPGGGGTGDRGGASVDPAQRERFRASVMEVLREEMRDLERRGTL